MSVARSVPSSTLCVTRTVARLSPRPANSRTRVANSEAAAAARDLAGYGIPAGPCGGAALAGVRAALTGEGAQGRRAALALDSGGTVVLLSTEGSAANPVPAG